MYNNYGYQSYSPYQQKPQAYGDEIKVVNGKESADAYIIAPNSRVILLDSTKDRFYIKTTDVAGVATVTAYDFVPAVDPVPEMPNYITREEVEAMINELYTKQQPVESTAKSSDKKTLEF